MTQEVKQLLLKDLSMRLPYGVKVNINSPIEEQNSMELFDVNIEYETIGVSNDKWTFRGIPIIDNEDETKVIKPYLRQMSSMTDKEWKEFSIFTGKTETYVQQICLDADSMVNPAIGGYKCVYWSLFDKCIDWLNEHHFDYRGLIEKGLALEAPKDMYKTE